jgi:predicted nucleic acid-binding protein
MADCRLPYVVDANIWRDLQCGDLLTAMFRLPFDWLVPDVVFDELRGLLGPAGIQELNDHSVQTRALSSAEVRETVRLAAIYPEPERSDLFALVLARSLRVCLLTGDRRLREAAEQEGVEVHGTLWLLDQMVEQEIIAARDAAEALERMQSQGRRLPGHEVQRRLEEWRRATP